MVVDDLDVPSLIIAPDKTDAPLVQPISYEKDLMASACQSASDRDPRSVSKREPLDRWVRVVALAPSELVGVAETGRARVGVIVDSALEAPAVIAGLDDVAVVGQAIEQRGRHRWRLAALADHHASNERPGTSEKSSGLNVIKVARCTRA